ncbi:protein kinase [Gordonia sp. X0973]|uniref:protein kinase domain-containing protein n=1 Tax=Gordonia sp. X0973 TaxID=2742602 RepID=UPI0026573A67|nr:protein kinase [Gordonia sp. X0973]
MTTQQTVPGPDRLVAGRYRLRSRIAEGGMGSVWSAKDELLGREVAVKRIVSLDDVPAENVADIRAKALHEGRIASKLAHDNAIAVHDVVLDDGTPWLVMEYVPSRSVAQILHTVGHLDPIEAAQIGAQIAAAMAVAHNAGIIHRDIKPGNILIASIGRDAGLVKLTDFGIAQHRADHTDDSGLVSGTPAYFAPEVARGAPHSEASDVYTLGSTIYTMVEGQPPFGADDEDISALLDRVARAQIRPPSNAGLLQDELLAMLTPSPVRRPTMAQVRDRLALLVATANRTTPEHVLTGRISRPDGHTPLWALATPEPPRMKTGSFPRSYVPAPPPQPRSTLAGAAGPASALVAAAGDSPKRSVWQQHGTAITIAAILVGILLLLVATLLL